LALPGAYCDRMSALITVLVFTVFIAGALPIIGIFVWTARHLVTNALTDTRAGRRQARGRLQMLLLLYGSVAAVLFAVGVYAAVKSQPFGLIVGIALMAVGLAYAWALYSANARSRRSSARPE
jgi:uncharacterized Tic20 family protein